MIGGFLDRSGDCLSAALLLVQYDLDTGRTDNMDCKNSHRRRRGAAQIARPFGTEQFDGVAADDGAEINGSMRLIVEAAGIGDIVQPEQPSFPGVDTFSMRPAAHIARAGAIGLARKPRHIAVSLISNARQFPAAQARLQRSHQEARGTQYPPRSCAMLRQKLSTRAMRSSAAGGRHHLRLHSEISCS